MIDWRRVPWTLWLLAILFAIALVRIELLDSIHGELRIFAAVFLLGWIYLLLRGSRSVWIGSLVLSVLSLLSGPVVDLASSRSPNVFALTTGVVQLLLLALPVTRRFFAGPVATA